MGDGLCLIRNTTNNQVLRISSNYSSSILYRFILSQGLQADIRIWWISSLLRQSKFPKKQTRPGIQVGSTTASTPVVWNPWQSFVKHALFCPCFIVGLGEWVIPSSSLLTNFFYMLILISSFPCSSTMIAYNYFLLLINILFKPLMSEQLLHQN